MRVRTTPKALVEPIRQWLLVGLFRQVVSNPALHLFILKNYHYTEEFGAAELRSVARLLADLDLKQQMTQHVADEEKHAALFKQRILELGGSPGLTPAELSVAFFRRFEAYGLGISDARLQADHPLEARELVRFLVPLKFEEDFGLWAFRTHRQAAAADPETAQMLDTVIPDEQRHTAYLAEALEKLGRSGYQADIDQALGICRKHFMFRDQPFHMKVQRLSTLLELCPYRPSGHTLRLVWWCLRPIVWAARLWSRRSWAPSTP
jgi:bacterioferritin (cytochrome b1)